MSEQLTKPSVLVVDDTPSTCIYIRAVLEHAGLDVTVAGSAEEGLEQLRARSFDLLLLDMCLPGLDGPGMLDRARAERLSIPRVAMMSANCDSHSVARADAAGAEKLLSKPIRADAIVGLMAEPA